MKKHRTDKFILNEQGEPVPEPDLLKWGRWFEANRKQRVVRQEWVGNVRVSTVFLGLDHNFNLKGPPVLWETMLFSNRVDCHRTIRCTGGREQAEAMHSETVALVKAMMETKTK